MFLALNLALMAGPSLAAAEVPAAREKGLYDAARVLSDHKSDELESVALAELRTYATLYPSGRFLDDVYFRMARLHVARSEDKEAAARLLQVLVAWPGSLREEAAREQLAKLLSTRALRDLRPRYEVALDRFSGPAPVELRRLRFVLALLMIDDERSLPIVNEELDALLGLELASERLAEVTVAVADFNRRAGARERSAQLFDRVVAVWPDDARVASALLSAAEVYLDLKLPLVAQSRLSRVARDMPEAPEAASAWLRMARVERTALRRPDIALRNLEEILGRYPDHPDAFEAVLLKAEIQAKDRREVASAVATLLDAAATQPDHPRAAEALLRVAKFEDEELGALASAASHYEQLGERYPGHEHADQSLWRSGQLYERSQDDSSAVRVYSELVRRTPGSRLGKRAAKRLSALR